MVLGSIMGNEEEEKKELNQLVDDVHEEIDTAQKKIQIDKDIIQDAQDAIGKINDLEQKENEIDQILEDITGAESVGALELAQNPEQVQNKQRELQRLGQDLQEAFSEAQEIEAEISDVKEKISNEMDLESIEREDMEETAKLVSRVEKQQREADQKLQSIENKLENTKVTI
jgi:chromosome segregation ATPase